MLNTYNAGIAYLKEKLGVIEVIPTYKREKGKMVISSRNYTYNHKEIIYRSTEHVIHLLLKQYYYGQSPKKELHDLLNRLGVENKL